MIVVEFRRVLSYICDNRFGMPCDIQEAIHAFDPFQHVGLGACGVTAPEADVDMEGGFEP